MHVYVFKFYLTKISKWYTYFSDISDLSGSNQKKVESAGLKIGIYINLYKM